MSEKSSEKRSDGLVFLAHGFGYDTPRFVAESSCRYLRPLSYPQPVDVGLRVAKLGNSSVAYDIGVFGLPCTNEETATAAGTPSERFLAATGTFVHVYVDAEGRPTPIGGRVRAALEGLAMAGT